MSIYKTVETQIDNPALLCEVLDTLAESTGLTYVYDEQATLDFYKWKSGTPRGTGAVVVIGRQNGGLDTTPRRYCGDTAIVPNGDGTYRVELDIAHGNAARNWQLIQNTYALAKIKKGLPRDWQIESVQIDPVTGAVKVTLADPRGGRVDRGERNRRDNRRERVSA